MLDSRKKGSQIAASKAEGQSRPTLDSARPGGFDPANSTAVTARFARGTTTVYTSYDTSCPEAGIDHTNKELIMNACLAKGDKVFLFNNRVVQI